jgi:hypothetical protein
MWSTLIFVAALGGLSASEPPRAVFEAPTQESRRLEAQKHQQERIRALAGRGRLSNYQQLLRIGKGRMDRRTSPYRSEASLRDAAIDLAGLGFTAADVRVHDRSNIDLFDVALRLFVGVTSSADAVLMADTVMVATAGEEKGGRNRVDGFLAEIPFTVLRPLKGARRSGDVVLIPRMSGPLPNGDSRRDFSEADFKAGKKYLLVLSKNWYEQYVALTGKRVENSLSALPFDQYEIAENGTLLHRSHSRAQSDSWKDLRAVEAELKSHPSAGAERGSGR